jgi:putative ABC transport system permease protein
MLVVGIGSGATVFSLINAVYFRPLPFRSTRALAVIDFFDRRRLCLHECRAELTVSDLENWTGSLPALDALALVAEYRAAIADPQEFVIGQGAAVSANLLSLLGLRPMIGRLLDAGDDRLNAPNVVVLSYAFWRDRYNADSTVIGRPLVLDGIPFVIVGVLPSEGAIGRPLFVGDSATAPFFVPISPYVARAPTRPHAFTLLGRLRAGADVGALRSQVAARLDQAPADPRASWNARVLSLRVAHARAVASAPYALFLGAVSFVLLLVCANLAGLFFARFHLRQREILVRAALGANWWQLARPFAFEGFICVGFGMVGGILLAKVATPLGKFLPIAGIPYWTPIAIDGRVFLFTAGLTLISVLLIGFGPALAASAHTSDLSLKDMSMELAPNRRGGRYRPILIAVEIQLALVLLTGAGTLGKAFVGAATRDIGRAKRSVIMASLAGRASRPLTPTEGASLAGRLVQQLGGLRGTLAVGASASGPQYPGLTREGDPQVTPVTPSLSAQLVTLDYFRASGIAVLEGRSFSRSDDANASLVTILDEETARRLFPNQLVIGRRIKLGDPISASDWMTIVGVVASTHAVLSERSHPFYPQIYQPLAQSTPTAFGISLVLSTREPTALALPSVRTAIRDVAPTVPLVRLASVEQLIDQELAPLRLTTAVLGYFALVSLAIAGLGVYGVVTQFVAKKAAEAGLRMALGAQQNSVLWLMVRPTIAYGSLGIAAGVASSLAASRVIRAFLYGESAIDPRVFVIATLVLAGTAALAAYMPARRATRVDPSVALRNL